MHKICIKTMMLVVSIFVVVIAVLGFDLYVLAGVAEHKVNITMGLGIGLTICVILYNAATVRLIYLLNQDLGITQTNLKYDLMKTSNVNS